MPDGRLLQLRAAYPVESAWAPAWVGDQLRQVRTAVRVADPAEATNTAEAIVAESNGDDGRAAKQRMMADSYRGIRDAYREREAALAAIMDDRAAWEAASRQQRQAAVAADAELRRRHPDQPWEPLRSAEPEPAIAARQADQHQVTPAAITAMRPSTEELAAQHRAFIAKLEELADRVAQVDQTEAAGRDRSFPSLRPGRTGAILQPPPPEIPRLRAS